MIHELEMEVLNLLGLRIERGRVFDTDKGQYLTFHGKYIYVQDPMGIVHRNDIKLDMLSNIKLSEYLLNVLIQKESEENGLYVQMISSDEKQGSYPMINMRALSIRTSDTVLMSDYFYNICLAYIHMIYIISGTPLTFDIHCYDYTPEQILQLQATRKARLQ